MNSLEEFIVSYPGLRDDDYTDKMGVMLEFRDMLYRRGEDGEYVNVANMDNEDDPFFRNYQMLIGRWLAPWTNNRTMLIRWDPGVGKTRAALSFASMWMRHSGHNKALLLSDQEIVHRALDDEVARYNRFDVELSEATYAMGRRAHGRLISTTTRLRKHGFEKAVIVRFLNAEIKASPLDTSGYMIKDARNRDTPDFRAIMEDQDNVRVLSNHLRKKYANHVIIVDEVHSMRYGKGKQSYDYLMIVLDALRDVCPILFLTATPIENSWKDAFSVVSMMHGPRVREGMLERIADLPDAPLDNTIVEPVLGMLRSLSLGRVSYRDSGGVVPDRRYVAPPGMVESGTYIIDPDTENEVSLDYMYPVFMGEYQSTRLQIRQIAELTRNDPDMMSLEAVDDAKNDIYSTSRRMFDVVGPEGDDGTYVSPETLVIDTDGVYTPSIDSAIRWEDGSIEEVFKLEYTPDGKIDTERGLGRYSIKYATMIDLLNREDSPLNGMAGYVHTLWVQVGIKVMAAALSANGWEQYTGSESITQASPRRFACIHGGTTSSDVGRIIETFNSAPNRSGSILRLILGSKKSGISISFTNARFFIEISSDFNKSKNIQSQGRVLRANALMWAREAGIPRDVIIMNMIALPVGSDQLDSIKEGYIINEEYAVDDGMVISNEDLAELIVDTVEGVTYEEAMDMTHEDVNDILEGIKWYNPYTVEVWMYYLSEIKYRSGLAVMETLRECSIETIITERLEEEANDKNDALLYGTGVRHGIKMDILDAISTDWSMHVNSDDMYSMRSVAELISSNTLAMNRYGFPRPVQAYGSSVSAFIATGCHSSQCALNITYDRNFFLTGSSQRMDPNVIGRAVDSVIEAPSDEYEFIRYISMINSSSIKIAILEITLSKPISLTGRRLSDFNRNRHHIINMYNLYWDTYVGGRILHILWYGLVQTQRAIRLGIVIDPDNKTREILHEGGSTIGGWRYITDPTVEAIYLTQMSDRVTAKERVIADNAMDYGFYVQMSIVDGLIRIKRVSIDGQPVSVDPISSSTSIPYIAEMLNTDQDTIRGRITGDIDGLRRDIYYAAKDRDILLIK